MSFEWSAYADLAERLIEVRDEFGCRLPT